MLYPRNNYGYFCLSIASAMVLRILPLPVSLDTINPDWVLLVLLYWSMTTPEKIGVINAWVIGLLVDVLTGRLLGQYALAYALACYVCVKVHNRLQYSAMLQQGTIIFLILLLSQSMLFWTENINSPTSFQIAFWLPVITGTLCWPLVYLLFHSIRFLR